MPTTTYDSTFDDMTAATDGMTVEQVQDAADTARRIGDVLAADVLDQIAAGKAAARMARSLHVPSSFDPENPFPLY